MAYSVKVIGQDDPANPYALAYGKGARKVKGVISRDGSVFFTTIDGATVVGKLKELKAQWGAWAATVYDGTTLQAPHGESESAIPKTAPDLIKYRQERINVADGTRAGQISAWCSAYNCETVSVTHGGTRDVYTLPPGPPIRPTLAECYDPGRDQYTWPHRYVAETERQI